jgi:hypothetical protein
MILHDEVGCITDDEMKIHIAKVLSSQKVDVGAAAPDQEIGTPLNFTDERFRVAHVDGSHEMIVENSSVIRSTRVKGFVSMSEGKFLSMMASATPGANAWFLMECTLFDGKVITIATDGNSYYFIKPVDDDKGEAVDMHILEMGFGTVDKDIIDVAIHYFSNRGGW